MDPFISMSALRRFFGHCPGRCLAQRLGHCPGRCLAQRLAQCLGDFLGRRLWPHALLLFLFVCVAVVVATPGCDSKRGDAPAPSRQAMPVSRLASELTRPAATERDGFTARYYEGYIAELVHGDMAKARAAYQAVIDQAGSEMPQLAARAALRLAEIEALAGQRRQALELMARASVLGRDNVVIVEQADRLHARLGSLRAAGSEVRGPPMGTVLDATVSDNARERFAAAETLLAAYHLIRLRPRLEQLRAGVRTKENAMEAAARAYGQVTALPEPAAQTAAEFRIASLHHDLALSLMFDLPPELDRRAATKLRNSLRTSALGHLEKARVGYRRAQAYAAESNEPASERWSAPATLALRSVEDLLGGTE